MRDARRMLMTWPERREPAIPSYFCQICIHAPPYPYITTAMVRALKDGNLEADFSLSLSSPPCVTYCIIEEFYETIN